MSIEINAAKGNLRDLKHIKRTNQRELQSLIYVHLLASGFIVNLEYSLRGLDFADGRRKPGKQHVSLDCVVFHPKTGLQAAIIVCKETDKHWQGWKPTRQEERYAYFGVPVLLVTSYDDLSALVKHLHRLLRVRKQA